LRQKLWDFIFYFWGFVGLGKMMVDE